MRLFYIFIALLFCGQISAADWHIFPLRISDDLTGLHFLNEKNGFITSTSGSIYHLILTDTGWVYEDNKLKKPLKGICFQENGKNGIAYGIKGAFFRTNDSGRTWIPDSLNATYTFAGVTYIENNSAVLIGIDYEKGGGTPGIAYKTTDGGLTWKPLQIDGTRFYSISKSPDNLLVITSLEYIYTSSDSGSSWQAAKVPARGYVQAAAVYGDKGIMVGKGGYLALSEDGGKNWEALPILDNMCSFVDVLMLDSRRAYIIGSNGEVLFTDDSGFNWIPEPSGAVEDLMDIQRVGNKIFACGKRGGLVYTEIDD